jgi:hypothetical protein
VQLKSRRKRVALKVMCRLNEKLDMRGLPPMFEETAFEHHFTLRELAQLWKFDVSTIRRIFIDEPGVLVSTARKDGGTGGAIT